MSDGGGFGIGVEHIKTEMNVGTLWRSAFNFGASFIFTIGRRYRKQASDTTKTWNHIPLFDFDSVSDFKRSIPHAWIPIGIELCDEARSLTEYSHARSAVYLLGPEDGSLSKEARALCKSVVFIPSRLCLNVATAGSIVMYDRMAKKGEAMTVTERSVTNCCKEFEMALQQGSDSEGWMALIQKDMDGQRLIVGVGLAAIKFCPWCGKELLPTKGGDG